MDLKDGYIDLEINDYVRALRERYKNEYIVIKELYVLFIECEKKMGKKGAFQQNAYIMASITQLYKLYQSAVLLFERGLKESANVLIRTILDLSFKIIEVIRNENYVDDLLIQDDIQFLKTLNNIKKNKLFDLVPEKDVNKFIFECNKRINNKNVKVDTAYALAEKNDLAKVYILYRMECDYTHQSTNVVGNVIKNSDKGVCIDAGFQMADFKESIAWLISITTIVLPILIDEYIVDIELKNKYNEFMLNFVTHYKDLIND